MGGVVRGEGKGVPVGDDGNKNSEVCFVLFYSILFWFWFVLLPQRLRFGLVWFGSFSNLKEERSFNATRPTSDNQSVVGTAVRPLWCTFFLTSINEAGELWSALLSQIKTSL